MVLKFQDELRFFVFFILLARKMSHERLSVSVQDHSVLSRDLIQKLFDDKNFTDVTLICSDGDDEVKTVNAHKTILSAVSPFFSKIFLEVKMPQTIIFLTDVDYKMMLSIITFIYKGETLVAEAEIDNFLTATKKLKIGGIFPEASFKTTRLQTFSQIHPGILAESSKNSDESPMIQKDVHVKSEPQEYQSPQNDSSEENNSAGFDFVKTEFFPEHVSTVQIEEKKSSNERKLHGRQHIRHGKQQIKQMNTAGKPSKKRRSVTNGFRCNYCGRLFISRDELDTHKKDIHNVIKV